MNARGGGEEGDDEERVIPAPRAAKATIGPSSAKAQFSQKVK